MWVSRFYFLLLSSGSTLPEVDPILAKWYRSDWIQLQIQNTGSLAVK